MALPLPTYRATTYVSDIELEAKVGKILTDGDYNLLACGPLRVLKPDRSPLLVYLPGALRTQADDPTIYEVLHGLRNLKTDNRGAASGTQRISQREGGRSRSRNIASAVVGAMDPAGTQKYCRLTAWTGSNLPEWEALRPLLRAVAHHLEQAVPDRYRAQAAEAAKTNPEWVVPGTPFTTVTVNNSYPTGVHTDKGDLDKGFSTIACLRKGTYNGGRLCFPRWRVAVDLQHGDLICMDAHEYHGNTMMVCACGNKMNGMCTTCGAERISVVSYFRTNVAKCGTPAQELARAQAAADARTEKHR